MSEHAQRGRTSVFLRGMLVLFTVPGISITGTSIGFGALAKAVGFSPLDTVFSSIVIFALPAQVMFADQWAREASWLAIAIAVTLTGVRLMPMTMSLMPLLRKSDKERSLGWPGLFAAHFVSITSWLEAFRQLPELPGRLRMTCYFGIATGIVIAGTGGALTGYYLAGEVDPLVLSVLLFMTPLYFLLSLFEAARRFPDFVAIFLGLALAPWLTVNFPSLDLVVSGLVGGTIAYVLGRLTHQRKPTMTAAAKASTSTIEPRGTGDD